MYSSEVQCVIEQLYDSQHTSQLSFVQLYDYFFRLSRHIQSFAPISDMVRSIEQKCLYSRFHKEWRDRSYQYPSRSFFITLRRYFYMRRKMLCDVLLYPLNLFRIDETIAFGYMEDVFKMFLRKARTHHIHRLMQLSMLDTIGRSYHMSHDIVDQIREFLYPSTSNQMLHS